MSQPSEQVETIETYCKWASQNLGNLNFEQKRLVLEALDIQVIVEGRKVMTKGVFAR